MTSKPGFLFQIYANRTIRMPPTADLENVKAAKLQDGVLVIEVPVTAYYA